jgi:hypothetical protein
VDSTGGGHILGNGVWGQVAIVTALTGATRGAKDHAAAARELTAVLGMRADAPAAEKASRELISAKGEVE